MVNNISHEQLNKLTEGQLFDLSQTIIANLKKRATRVQPKTYHIIQHYSGCYTFPPYTTQTPNFIKDEFAKFKEKYKNFVQTDPKTGRIHVFPVAYYHFIRKFYKYIKDEDASPVELKFEIVLKEDPTR